MSQGNGLGRWPLIGGGGGGVAAAIAAALCWVGPLVLVMLGISGALGWESYDVQALSTAVS